MKDYQRQLFLGEGKWTCECIFRRNKSNVIYWVDHNTMEVRNKETGSITVLTFSYYGHCINAVTE